MLMTAVLACGETGDTTATASTQATTDDPATASGTETTGDGPTSTGTTAEPTSGTAGASETSDATTTTGTTGTTTAETTEATTAVDTTGETSTSDTTTGETTDTTDTTGETTDTTGGSSPLVIAIVDAYLFADCQPVVDPDPVQGTWYVEFDNTDNPDDTSAVIVAASLSLADADPPVIEPIMVQPVESPPIAAGDYVSVEMTKTPGAMHSACEHCDEFYKLVLEYDEGGVKHHVEEDVTISCSF